jgi:hypothetical protein
MSAVAQLLKYGSPPISASQPDAQRVVQAFGGEGSNLFPLLVARNGFYAFDGALHVFSDAGDEHEPGVIAWNESALWRADYDGMADDALFFAEDVFGVQFCLRRGTVSTFDPETAQFEITAKSIDDWCLGILRDSRTSTGWPMAREWCEVHGRIPRGRRLVPTVPFVLGGDFKLANLKAIDAVIGMKFRASIARQIRDLPDGATVELKVVD